MSGNGSLVGADETLLRIVGALTESGPAGVTELAERLDLTKSTTHRHLKTLAAHGYAINDGGTYRLSHQWFHVGTVVKSRQPFYVAAKQPLRDLADRTGETAWAAIEEGGRLMFVNGAGSNPTHNPDLLVGDWSPITRTAAGKAILAYLPDDRLDEILVETAPAATASRPPNCGPTSTGSARAATRSTAARTSRGSTPSECPSSSTRWPGRCRWPAPRATSSTTGATRRWRRSPAPSSASSGGCRNAKWRAGRGLRPADRPGEGGPRGGRYSASSAPTNSFITLLSARWSFSLVVDLARPTDSASSVSVHVRGVS